MCLGLICGVKIDQSSGIVSLVSHKRGPISSDFDHWLVVFQRSISEVERSVLHLILSPSPLWSESGQGMGTDAYRLCFPTSCASRIPAGRAQWEVLAGGWGASGSESQGCLSSFLLQMCLHRQLHIFPDSSGTPNSGLLLVTSAFGLWRHTPSVSQPCWQLLAIAKVWVASLSAVQLLSSSIVPATSSCIKFLQTEPEGLLFPSGP